MQEAVFRQADANILATYGINAYRVLADRLGVDQKVVRKLGEKGLLGPDSIRLLFQTLAEQARGAQKDAMNSWSGLTAMMGDVWDPVCPGCDGQWAI